MKHGKIIECSYCGQAHKLPFGKLGTVKCKTCSASFEADTRSKNDSPSINNVISKHELKKLLHPTETSRFLIALLIAFPITISAVSLIFATFGLVLIGLSVIIFTVWFVLQISKASLIGSSVLVSPHNFPEIHEILVEVKARLEYKKNVDIYITENGNVNAFLYKFFQTKFILLNSEVVHSMPTSECREQLVWILGRFIGSLKAKHARFQLLSIIIKSIEKIKIFNLLILPYERATQYSGDQIGMALCSDLQSAIVAFDKLLVGNDIAKDVQIKGLLEQANQLHFSFFGRISKILSTHPHMTDRYLNLIAFARYMYPEEFQKYIAQFDNVTVSEMGSLLPKYYPLNKSGKQV